jgi:hypothetical protein
MVNDNKLIERITTCLEEFGMPKFQDRFPAMSVLQILKDSGYLSEPNAGTPKIGTPKPVMSEKEFIETGLSIQAVMAQEFREKNSGKFHFQLDVFLPKLYSELEKRGK